jgi:transposase-like protein
MLQCPVPVGSTGTGTRWTVRDAAPRGSSSHAQFHPVERVVDVCRKLGIKENSYYRWRQQLDPAKTDDVPLVATEGLPR